MHLLLTFFLYGIWTSVFALGKITLSYCPPLLLTASRMLLAGSILILFLWISNKKKLHVPKAFLPALLLLALFSIYLTNILEFWGLQHISSAKVCFIYSLTPFFTALLSFIHFKEKMNWKKGIGLSLGIVGFLPSVFIQTGSENLFQTIFYISWPELAIIGASFFSVYGWILLRMLVKNDSLSPITANGYSMLIGGAMALMHSLIVDAWAPFPVASNHLSYFMQGTLLMTFISNIICYNLYGYLLKRFTATFLSFIGLLCPFFASVNGYLILGEPFSPILILSCGIIILGVFLIYQSELKQGYIVKKKATI